MKANLDTTVSAFTDGQLVIGAEIVDPYGPTAHFGGRPQDLPDDCEQLLVDADAHNLSAQIAALHGWDAIRKGQETARDEAMDKYCRECKAHPSHEERCGGTGDLLS